MGTMLAGALVAWAIFLFGVVVGGSARMSKDEYPTPTLRLIQGGKSDV